MMVEAIVLSIVGGTAGIAAAWGLCWGLPPMGVSTDMGPPVLTAPVALGTLAALGAVGCVFGPGDIRVAHRTGEHVPIAELARCAAILERAIERFCG